MRKLIRIVLWPDNESKSNSVCTVYKYKEPIFQFITVKNHFQVLPSEYGGTGGSLAEIIDYWVKEAANQKDWFARFL